MKTLLIALLVFFASCASSKRPTVHGQPRGYPDVCKEKSMRSPYGKGYSKQKKKAQRNKSKSKPRWS